MLIRSLIVLSLIYQYFFCSGTNELFLSIFSAFKPTEYFDKYEVITEGDIKQSHSLFCFHPHGVFCYGMGLARFKEERLWNNVICGTRALTYLPFGGLLALWFGAKSVDASNFEKFMKQGSNISFIPGGFEEATLTHNEKDRVFIKNRKGFIKYALRHGYNVHPVYTFGENKTYNSLNNFDKFCLFINKLKLPKLLFWGKFWLLPRDDVELNCVIGEGIKFPVIENPTSDEINQYHELYLNKLKSLYDKHKTAFKASAELEIY